MTVRAKFTVQSITRTKHYDKSKGDLFNVKLAVVTSGSKENDAFYASTPGGFIEMSSINEAAVDGLPLGAEVYVDFTIAE